MTNLLPICSDLFPYSHINHGFFTRLGGVSTGVYRALNGGHGSHDAKESVQINRARVAQFFDVPPAHLLAVHQAHTSQVICVDSLWSAPKEGDPRPIADALVTNIPGYVLSIVTADCGPVLLADPKARVIGAAHAGWRGALGGILDETVKAMVAQGAQRHCIRAVLGPTIHAPAYEVEREEFMKPFLARCPEAEVFFTPCVQKTHVFFDLPGFICHRLRSLEVGYVSSLNLCTYEDEKRFFSYRRSCKRSEGDYGRLISAICLKT
jgi:YfiH family protein